MTTNRVKTFSALSSMKPAVEDRIKLPNLKEEIKSLKDGLYSVLRVAYLPQWGYYILETDKFKQNVNKKNQIEIFQSLPSVLKSQTELWFYIEGMNWSVLTQGSDGKWIEYNNTNSDTWVWEGAIEAYIPTPKDLDIDWDATPF